MTLPAIDILLSATASAGASLLDTPSRVAVFGGSISSPAEVSAGNNPKSQRDAFVRWVKQNQPDLAKRLLLPENYDDWNDFNTYSDLLRFEEDLGYVTAVVVIFLEASGAIAELGAFSQIKTLNQQLVVVVTDVYHPKKSFISLGPLRQLDRPERTSVCVIPQRPLAEFAEDIDIILQSIEEKIGTASARRAWQASDPKHQIILALDVVTLLEVATFGDVKAALTHFGVPIQDARIRQVLFTLAKADLISSKRYGGIDYYFPIERGKTWIDHAGPDPTKKFNRLRIAARIAVTRTSSLPAAKAHGAIFRAGKA